MDQRPIGMCGAFLKGAVPDRALVAIGPPQEQSMTMHRWSWRSLPVATALVASVASVSSAQWGNNRGQGEELFEWNGSVDREVQITMRGNRVFTNNIGATESGRYNARAMTSMPRQN